MVVKILFKICWTIFSKLSGMISILADSRKHESAYISVLVFVHWIKKHLLYITEMMK